MGVEIFAKRIKDLRISHGLTTRMMGEKIGVSHSSIAFYENCTREPSLTVMKAYADYFNVSLDFLCGREKK